MPAGLCDSPGAPLAPVPTRPGPLPVLHLDERLVVVSKPSGLLVHRTQLDAHEEWAALQLVRDQIGQHVYPVHRLDKGTSGALAFALDPGMASCWAQALEEGSGRQVRKTYAALVRGWPPAEGVIRHPLARDPEKPSQGQPMLAACTRFWRLGCLEWPESADGRFPTTRHALVVVRIDTGRRHQIRRHFKHLAHPLLGDTTHGKSEHNRFIARMAEEHRLWLHARSLSWDVGTGPAGRGQALAPWPAAWQAASQWPWQWDPAWVERLGQPPLALDEAGWWRLEAWLDQATTPEGPAGG